MTEEQKQKKARTEAREQEMAQENLNAQLQLMQARDAAASAAERKALRDDFAKAALTGLLAHHGNPNLRSLADSAFQYADFMMEIRDGGAR